MTPDETARLRLQLERIGVPPVTARVLLGERGPLLDTAACAAARRFLVEMGAHPWVLISGGIGCGKSIGAALVVTELYQATGPGSAVWVNAIELAGLDRWSSRVKGLAQARAVLVLDDVGPYATSRLEQVAYPRADALARTVLTTSLTPEAFERAHPRVFDRLREIGKIVELDGPSMRGAAEAEDVKP